jgi:transglutaminase-like putative cysteine protease
VSTASVRPPDEKELPIASEVVLTALTLAAVIGFARLFENARFFGPAFIAAVGSHLVARIARRLGLDVGTAALVSLAIGTIALVWLVVPSTTTYGIPRGASWHALGHDLRVAWRAFGDVVAPTPSTPGFVASIVIATWVAAFLADTAAFRMLTTFEAVVPSLALFIFSSALGPDRHRVRYTVVYLVGVIGFVLVRTATRRAETTSWFAGRRGGGAGTIVQGGVGLAVAGIVAGALVGPALPGATGSALLGWRDRTRDGPRSRITVSPLVDIRNRLIEEAETELFTVRTSFQKARYWRLTALDDFDGTIWKSSNSYRPASGPLAEAAAQVRTETLRQEYSIAQLSSIWLPAASRPASIKLASGARYDKESDSLISSTDTTNGLQYEVVSKMPRYTEAALERVVDRVPGHIRSRYLPLPEEFPRRVVLEARRITGAASSTYAKARALQDYFRDPRNFTYDTSVEGGHDQDAIVHFLFDSKRGYCQQFAGTYAAMARAIGLPSRVAVGFVPGLVRDGVFHVRGKDAHAWPEVYLHGFGWVPFEPTPARAAPGGEAYAGTPAYQAQTTDAAPTATSAAPTTTAPRAGGSSSRGVRDLATEGTEGGDAGAGRPWWRDPVPIALGLVVAALAGLAAVPIALAARRRHRRAAASTPGDRVLVAWEEAEEILAVAAGLPRRPAETPLEYARRVTAAEPVDAAQMHDLAQGTLAASFSASGVDAATADRAVTACDGVRMLLLDRATVVQRLRWACDPRRLRPGPRRR